MEQRTALDERWREGLDKVGVHRKRAVWHLTFTDGRQARGTSIRNPYGDADVIGLSPDERVNTPECLYLGERGGEYRWAAKDIARIEEVIDRDKQLPILYDWTAAALEKARRLSVPLSKTTLLRHLTAWGEHSAAYELATLSDEDWEQLDLWGWRTEEVGEVFEVIGTPCNTPDA